MNNSKKISDEKFFTCPAEELAQKLLGKVLCHRVEGKVLRFMITETEAYGKDDPYTHAKANNTGNAVEIQKKIGGTIYVHYRTPNSEGSMFDIVSGNEGKDEGEGVLIRAALDLDSFKLYNGPMKLGCAFKMKYENNGKHLLKNEGFWLEEIETINIKNLDETKVTKKPRTGLSKPEKETKTEDRKNKEKYFGKELNFSIFSC